MRDAVVIGGGFYGAVLAIHLVENRGLRNVTLIERESILLSRASYNNQARIHNGYHYPRSFTTAYRSHANMHNFVRDFSFAARKDFTKLYAIARRNSKVSSAQFERFCSQIGAALTQAAPEYAGLFDSHLIEAVYEVQEYAFDAAELRAWAKDKLAQLGIEVVCDTHIDTVNIKDPDLLQVDGVKRSGETIEYTARYVINCTYSGLNRITGDAPSAKASLKHEMTEMALIQMPAARINIGVTVMDGPFFSVMPFPARGLHTLSHVRYTPHREWLDRDGVAPYEQLAAYDRASRYDRMIRDAARYMPCMADAHYRESLFEVKTILMKNETDDGRPILFERSKAQPNFFSILGGKIDNIYDVLKKIDEIEFA